MKQERNPPLIVQFKEGYFAFSKGWLKNSYGIETLKGKEWQRGFDRAYFDNLQRIKQNA